MQALDRYTVRFTLKYPYSEFPDTLGEQAFLVWPVDYLRKVGLKAYEQHPVGTGPYEFLRRVPGTSIDLVRNPQWWDTSGGPYIDTIHYVVFGSVTAMMLAFQKGTVDWTPVPQGQVVASRSLPQVKSGRWKAESTPQLSLQLPVRQHEGPAGGRDAGTCRCGRPSPTGAIRQAAIDAASDGVVPAADRSRAAGRCPGRTTFTEPYPYDPAKAAELVKRTGPVTLELAYPLDQQRQATAESLTASYAKIGITIKPRGVAVDRLEALSLASARAQLFFGGWMADYPSMDNFLYPAVRERQLGVPARPTRIPRSTRC